MKTPLASIDQCALCEEAAIQVQCKVCKAWLYCSKGEAECPAGKEGRLQK